MFWTTINQRITNKIRVEPCDKKTGPGPRDYKRVFMLDSTEHEISTAYRIVKKFLALSLSDVVFIMLINVKMSTIVGILTFMSRIIFVLS